MDASEKRRAQNEALFREVNERIEELTSSLAGENEQDESLQVICECATDDCTELIEMTHGEYEAVRSDPRRFLVLPGHEHTDAARVVERNTGFVVIQKLGEAAEIAVEHDPR